MYQLLDKESFVNRCCLQAVRASLSYTSARTTKEMGADDKRKDKERSFSSFLSQNITAITWVGSDFEGIYSSNLNPHLTPCPFSYRREDI